MFNKKTKILNKIVCQCDILKSLVFFWTFEENFKSWQKVKSMFP